MMDIVVGAIAPVQDNQRNKDKKRRSAPKDQKMIKERRKNKVDRRRGVRDGVVVTLSTQPNRRKNPDRRKNSI